jgi:hypothetical protein
LLGHGRRIELNIGRRLGHRLQHFGRLPVRRRIGGTNVSRSGLDGLHPRRRGGGHETAVVGGEAVDLLGDVAADGVVADAVQVRESVQRGEAVSRDRAGDRVAQIGRQGPVDGSGDDGAALDVDLLLRPLLRHLLHDPVMYIAVRLIDGNVAVTVEVGATVPKARHQLLGEYRLDGLTVCLVTLERVLGSVRGGQHRAAATLKPFECVHRGVGLGQPASRESPAVTAVEDQDLLSRDAALHRLVNVLGR